MKFSILVLNETELLARTKHFTLRVMKLVDALPATEKGRSISAHVLKSSTAVAYTCRVACKARSRTDFVTKFHAVEEAMDESVFWLELIVESGLLSGKAVDEALKEAHDLAVFIAGSKKSTVRNAFHPHAHHGKLH